MYVAVIHSISDPQKFWATAEETAPPEGISIHSSLPNEDGSRAVCLWEADSLEAVRRLVDDSVGDVSNNEFFEVNADNARGLPS